MLCLSVSAFAADSGIIRGEFHYPGKTIPKNLEVCADEIHTHKSYCTKTFTKKKSGWAYAGKIPVGEYWVLARSGKSKGYYSTNINCKTDECKSHQRIIVHLFANQELTGIDPDDWAIKKIKPETDMTLEEFKVDGYRFRSLCDQTYGGSVSLVQGGEEVFHQDQCGHPLSFGPKTALFDPQSFHLPIVKDITGSGSRTLAVAFFSGGAHCCWSHTALLLKNPIEVILKTKNYNEEKPLENPGGVWESSSSIEFEDLGKNGKYDIIGYDETFDYWNGPYYVTTGVRPKVIFKFENGQYVLAPDLMKKPTPSSDEFNDKVNEVAENLSAPEFEEFQDPKWGKGGVRPELWGTMLRYLYSGNSDWAWKFYDRVWGDDRPGKKEFLEEFKKQLEKSPYWPAIKAMNSEQKSEAK